MTPYAPPKPVPIVPVFLDEHLIVLNKPSGLLSVPGRLPEKSDCLISRARDAFPDALIVHRLDMETSGLIALARSPDVHRALSKLFEARRVDKRYIARVAGRFADRTGQIDLPLNKDWPNRPLQKVDHEGGKPALTDWRVLEVTPDTTRLELTPLTGRTHQLRVHLNEIGHPILGDLLYGSEASRTSAERLQLHASALGFVHPVTGADMMFQSDAPF